MKQPLTHRRSEMASAATWARCGEDNVVFDDAQPTCLSCIAGRWMSPETEIVRILTLNSVKDIQAIEDARFIEQVDRIIGGVPSDE